MTPAIRIAGFLAVLAGQTQAQDMQRSAEDALSGLGSVTDRITTGTMRETVVPFAGTDLDAAEMSPDDFDREILDIRTGDGSDGRAFQSTLDSMEQRAPVDLGDDPLGLANLAVENAEATVGGLFSADGGTCEALFQNGSYDGLKFCNAILKRDIRVCEVWREISVDREDFWACEMAERDFTRVCNPTISWACTGLTGPSCRRNRMRADRPFTWANNSTQMRFSLGSNVASTGCFIYSERITVDAYVGLNLSRLEAARWRYKGIVQLRVNGETIWTHGTNSRGRLNIQYQDVSGKDGGGGLIPVVYAGGTPIDYCDANPEYREMPSTKSLLGAIDRPVVGPSRISANLRPYMPMNEHEKIYIELLTAYSGRAVQNFWLDVPGACCSRITSVGGETC